MAPGSKKAKQKGSEEVDAPEARELLQRLDAGQELPQDALRKLFKLAQPDCPPNCGTKGSKGPVNPRCLCWLVPAEGSHRKKGLWMKEPALGTLGHDPADDKREVRRGTARCARAVLCRCCCLLARECARAYMQPAGVLDRWHAALGLQQQHAHGTCIASPRAAQMPHGQRAVLPTCAAAAAALCPPRAAQSPEAPAGLRNLGNTCYVNAAMQFLVSMPSFRRALYVLEPHLAEQDIVRQLR